MDTGVFPVWSHYCGWGFVRRDEVNVPRLSAGVCVGLFHCEHRALWELGESSHSQKDSILCGSWRLRSDTSLGDAWEFVTPIEKQYSGVFSCFVLWYKGLSVYSRGWYQSTSVTEFTFQLSRAFQVFREIFVCFYGVLYRHGQNRIWKAIHKWSWSQDLFKSR